MTEQSEFKDARRELRSLTAPLEKRVLLWLAVRMPSWVNSDHLTLLGLIATAVAAFSYYLSRWNPAWLHGVNLCLAINWFGDSLDGTLARQRNRLRPRYGFYVDHMVDAFGALFLLVGLALSGYMSERVAMGLLIVYYALSIHIYLATYTLGVFKISYGIFGGTELRILLVLGNLALLYRPRLSILGAEFLLFDLVGIVGMAGLGLVLVASVVGSTSKLYRMEPIDSSAPKRE